MKFFIQFFNGLFIHFDYFSIIRNDSIYLFFYIR